MMNDKISAWSISDTADLKFALKKMNSEGKKILFLVGVNMEITGSLSDGDIRRWILSTGQLEGSIKEFCNFKPITVSKDYSISLVRSTMLEKKIEAIPVIDNKNRIIGVLTWTDIICEADKQIKTNIDVPVVIMAGGQGTRLDPLTRIIPKPMVPVGEKPIIEVIIERFRAFNVQEFYLSLNYKSFIIKAYFDEINPPYSIRYITESKPLGTAGSLYSLKGKIEKSFFVSNCDILIDTDYSQIFEHHQVHKNDITIVTSLKYHRIPYGVCHISDGGDLVNIEEKPEYNLLINTGMYILKPDILDFIPEDSFFHFTDLIQSAMTSGRKVGIYPIREDSWVDIGEMEGYKEFLKNFKI